MKNNKKYIFLIIIMIIIIGSVIFKIYSSNFKQNILLNSANVTINENEFYKIDNLLKNNYLTRITTEESGFSQSNIAIKIDDEKVYVLDNLIAEDNKNEFILAQGIQEKPKYVYVSNVESPLTSQFIVLCQDGSLYYANSTKNNNKIVVSKFNKIQNNVKNIYEFYTNKYIEYPYKDLTIYIENNKNDLISLKNGKISTSFKEDFPNPDIICGWNIYDELCTGIYISVDRKLFKDNTKEIKYKNKSFNIKEIFSNSKYYSNGELEQTIYYVINEDNNIYTITEDENANIISVQKYNNLKVTSYKYNKANNSIIVEYKNGEKEGFGVEYLSTLYYRYNK